MTPLFTRTAWIAAGIIGIGGVSYFIWAAMKPQGPGIGFVSGNGRIEATEIDVATTLAGRLVEISVNEGDFVEAYQLLSRIPIDSPDAQKDEANTQYRQTLMLLAPTSISCRSVRDSFPRGGIERGVALVRCSAADRQRVLPDCPESVPQIDQSDGMICRMSRGFTGAVSQNRMSVWCEPKHCSF
jgi:hypothetical protein